MEDASRAHRFRRGGRAVGAGSGLLSPAIEPGPIMGEAPAIEPAGLESPAMLDDIVPMWKLL